MSLSRDPSTVWKLVDARCLQLADAVRSARIPFLISLSWSFIWAVSLYVADFGYLTYERQLLRDQYADSSKNPMPDKTINFCKLILPNFDEAESANLAKACREELKTRRDNVEKSWTDSTFITFPGGFGKIHISDLGIVGQSGLSLILSWLFFAVRRENHAIRAIVDMDDDTRKLGFWRPRFFTLLPQDETLSAEHVAYAYHSIAQRFVFLFSQFSRPLTLFTFTLCILPSLIAVWNLITDIRDVIPRRDELRLLMMVFGEFGFVLFILLLTYFIIRHELDNSVLLNGWYLAARDVWMKEWDERTQDPASEVEIDVFRQKATGKSAERAPSSQNYPA